MAQPPPTPTGPLERIDAIDVLRGAALFGVLAINLVTEFRVSIFQQFLPGHAPASAIDRAVEAFLMLAVDMKAFALFSLLFGTGLAIQFERLASSPHRLQLLMRRLMVLLAIGLLHLILIWNGDILTSYALAGFVALPFLYGSQRLLAGMALGFIALYLATPLLLPPGVFPGIAAMARDVTEADRIYATGHFSDVLAFRIRELPLIAPLHVYVFARTVGLFLAGAWIWRAGVVQSAGQHRGLLLSIAAFGICGGLALTAVASNGLFGSGWTNQACWSFTTVIVALGYGAAIIAATATSGGKRWLGWLAPLGRMAFTNYLAQSLIFGWMFYGYGLGLFGRLGAAAALAIGIVVYLGQALFSAWWLHRYRFGPIEWVWRSLMYGKVQPMLPRV